MRDLLLFTGWSLLTLFALNGSHVYEMPWLLGFFVAGVTILGLVVIVSAIEWLDN